MSLKKLFLIMAIWLAAVTVGFYTLLSYSFTTKPLTLSDKVWPMKSKLIHGDKPALVMFLHPYCPCSKASLNQLMQLLTKQNLENIKINFVFYKPSQDYSEWQKGTLWSIAETIPGANLIIDKDGKEFKNFHPGSSGDVFFYDTKGHLVFRGGITPERGHMGPNFGESQLKRAINGKYDNLSIFPVLGCSLTGQAK